jgi:hypothetical protein
MTTKIEAFTTETVLVQWGHLHQPDDKFGADSANHNISVVVDKPLQKKLDLLLKESGATKINGMRVTPDGDTVLKAKSKTLVKKGEKTFPCRDASSAKTDAIAFGGDMVRLRLAPAVLTRDGSMSLYLNGCQIIEKNSGDFEDGGSGGFESTEGFTSAATEDTDTEEFPI